MYKVSKFGGRIELGLTKLYIDSFHAKCCFILRSQSMTFLKILCLGEEEHMINYN